MNFLDNIGLEELWYNIISKLGKKVDKEEGKGLSTNDYTNEDKQKLENLSIKIEELQAEIQALIKNNNT